MTTRQFRLRMAIACVGAPIGILYTAPLGTAFTYQGRLKSAGQPFNGTANLVFKLYDASGAGRVRMLPLMLVGLAGMRGGRPRREHGRFSGQGESIKERST